jgi:signal transduction histidine kinase
VGDGDGEREMLERKNVELEAFSARVAHDLMSPLMTVGLAVGVAEQRVGPEDERLHAMLSRAGGALVRVRQTVTDLLEFARAAAKPQPAVETAVAPLLQAVVGDLQPLASEAGVDLTVSRVSERCVRCAPGILSSIVSNLVQNAIRYTRDEPERHVDVRVLDVGSELRFEVEDTGPGVRPEDREQIFEPYVRRSRAGDGLGLGLATVKRLAESHGGHVGVRSAQKHGALFWVTLPSVAS